MTIIQKFSTPSASNRVPAHTPGGRLMLTLAMSEYDQVRDFTSGALRAEGIEINHLSMPVEEIFFRFLKFREWDVSEMSMGKFVSLISQGDTTLTSIPVFPSRIFRHSSIFVRRDGPVRTPADLVGRRVGLPEWAQTAAIYTRGMLMHRYGLRLDQIEWVQAGVNQPGRVEKVKLNLPAGVRYAAAPDRTLDAMLRDGEVDAVMTAHLPDSFKQGAAWITRLFDDFRQAELEYWQSTGIFPIMHTVAIRTAVLEAHPWVAMNLFKAFEAAKNNSLERALEATAPRFPLPWLTHYAEDARRIFGADFWPYGIERNRTTLAAFLQFAHEQGVTHRPVAIEELFPPNMSTSFRI